MRPRVTAAALVVAATPLAATAAETAALTVKVVGVTDKGGDLRVGVYDEATFVVRGSKPVTGKVVPATAGTMTVTFDGLEPGEYGVKVLQDENRNGKMDMSMMGMKPAEPFGMSNNARPSMAGPPWSDAKFAVRPGANAISVILH